MISVDGELAKKRGKRIKKRGNVVDKEDATSVDVDRTEEVSHIEKKRKRRESGGGEQDELNKDNLNPGMYILYIYYINNTL